MVLEENWGVLIRRDNGSMMSAVSQPDTVIAAKHKNDTALVIIRPFASNCETVLDQGKLPSGSTADLQASTTRMGREPIRCCKICGYVAQDALTCWVLEMGSYYQWPGIQRTVMIRPPRAFWS